MTTKRKLELTKRRESRIVIVGHGYPCCGTTLSNSFNGGAAVTCVHPGEGFYDVVPKKAGNLSGEIMRQGRREMIAAERFLRRAAV